MKTKKRVNIRRLTKKERKKLKFAVLQGKLAELILRGTDAIYDFHLVLKKLARSAASR